MKEQSITRANSDQKKLFIAECGLKNSSSRETSDGLRFGKTARKRNLFIPQAVNVNQKLLRPSPNLNEFRQCCQTPEVNTLYFEWVFRESIRVLDSAPNHA